MSKFSEKGELEEILSLQDDSVRKTPKRVTFKADTNIFYGQNPSDQSENSGYSLESLKNVQGSDTAFIKAKREESDILFHSTKEKSLNVEPPFPPARVMFNSTKQDPSTFVDRDPSRYEFTTSGRRRRGAIKNALTKPIMSAVEGYETEMSEQDIIQNGRVVHTANEISEPIGSSTTAETSSTHEERSTRSSQIEALKVSLNEKDTSIIALRAEHEKVMMQLIESEKLRGMKQGEIVQLQNQVEKLAGELARAQQQIKKQQEESSRLAIEASKVELEGRQELLLDIKQMLTKISNDILMPPEKMHDSIDTVSNALQRLETFAEASNEQMLQLIDKERKQHFHELSFQKIEKQRLVDEMYALKHELKRGKDEWASERSKLVAEIENSFRHREDIERIHRLEQQRLSTAREELARDVILLEKRLDSSREELANADSTNRELKAAKENLEQEAMRLESLARDLHSYSSMVSKRDEEINYLFQLANEAQEYSAKGQAKLENDALQIKKSAENAQRERYILAKDRLQLLQKRYAMKLYGDVQTRDWQHISNEDVHVLKNVSLWECSSAIKDQPFLQSSIFSTRALSNIKKSLVSMMNGKESEITGCSDYSDPNRKESLSSVVSQSSFSPSNELIGSYRARGDTPVYDSTFPLLSTR